MQNLKRIRFIKYNRNSLTNPICYRVSRCLSDQQQKYSEVCFNTDRRALFSSMFMFQSVIDGDLCEYFNSLDSSKRRSIAEELDRTPAEVKSQLCFYKFFSQVE